jgi:hypothetical protein
VPLPNTTSVDTETAVIAVDFAAPNGIGELRFTRALVDDLPARIIE